MKLLNYIYSTKKSLEKFIEKNSIGNSNTVLIQLFSSKTTTEKIYRIRDEITACLPNASLIGSSTAGVISDGDIIDNYVVVSFSIFEASTTKSKGYTNLNIDTVVDDISHNIITDTTKLLVLFADTYTFPSSDFLDTLSSQFPNIVIAGGNGGDDFVFESCELFSKEENHCTLVVASINSNILKVQTKYLLNYKSVGKEMIVTKSRGNIIYEIDNKNVLDLYKYYLGVELHNKSVKAIIDFPLIIKRQNVNVARAPISVNEDESLSFTGDIKEGERVCFGYADMDYIETYNNEYLLADTQYHSEGAYIYSCAARRSKMGGFLKNEISTIDKIAPTSGFITYGEFFHDGDSCKNNLLNVTSTYVLLDEHINTQEIISDFSTCNITASDTALKALSTLLSRTTEELKESLHYLSEFKKVINDTSIISVTDEKGIITDVNQNFVDLSGYTKEELIGKPHNIVRHSDMSQETFNELWQTIKNKKIWKGIIKNCRKDGSSYTVVSEIAPICNIDGSFKEFIGVRTDITQLEEYKLLLKSELDVANRSLEENINYANQYEEAINSMVYIIKTDTHNVVNYANEAFCDVSGYTSAELIGNTCSAFKDKRHIQNNDCSKILKRIKQGEEIEFTFYNKAKSGAIFIADTLVHPIVDKDKNVVEVLHVMHDITEIVQLNEDITETQREVVATMGAIGETRSKETGLHVKRVAEYSYELARLYGLSEEEASLLKQASPMHDIGKVGIADNILNKPGKLTDAEFEIMKTHAQLGYEMLKHSQRPILNASAIVAKTHHEKWNGSGYPRGLKGYSIPIFGRITAVTDVFDALGHDRVYKKAWPLEEILELFKKESGKHFDPKLIKLFLENLDVFLKIRDKMQDSF